MDGDRQVIHLDMVIDEQDDHVRFRTEERPAEDLVGRKFGLQQWWVPEAMQAVCDLSRSWKLVPAPGPELHEHCLLGYEAIQEGEGEGRGWRSGDDWICTECFRRYITEDHLRVRGSPERA